MSRCGRPGEHDPRAVVVGEHERLLDHTSGGDVPPCPHLVQRVSLPHRDQAVEVAKRGRTEQDLDPDVIRPPRKTLRVFVPALPQQCAAKLDVVVASTTSAPSSAARMAAESPATPPPMTSTSQ